MHEYQEDEEFVRTMMVLHPRLLLDVNRNALALKRLGLTVYQLLVLGVSKRAMEAAGIDFKPRWIQPGADNPKTAEAYRGKVHGNRITGYDKKYGTGYAKRDGFHTGSLFVIAELPLYRTKAIPSRGRYRVRFRLNRDFTQASRLIAGVYPNAIAFKYWGEEHNWSHYGCIYGLQCDEGLSEDGRRHVTGCDPEITLPGGWRWSRYEPSQAGMTPHPRFGFANDIIDIVVEDCIREGKCATFINDELIFEQVICSHSDNLPNVPIVMAQEVDITLESVDELPRSAGLLQAGGQLPTEGQLQAGGQLPTEGQLQAGGQLPTVGQLQAEGLGPALRL